MSENRIIKIQHSKGFSLQFGARIDGNGVIFTVPIKENKTLKLMIYDKKHDLVDCIYMQDYKLNGAVSSVCIKGISAEEFTYQFEEDGKPINDYSIKNTGAVRKYGEDIHEILEGKVYNPNFDWEGDENLKLDFKDIIAYQLHVRGFTAHKTSKVKHKGQFLGIVEKIPYLKSLGINQIVIMPAYEFDELDRPDPRKFSYLEYKAEDENQKPEPKINFWGFKQGLYYLPKISYAEKDPVNEFKSMVKELHKAGIEIIMRFFFPGTYNKSFIRDILRFWVYEYHVDGFFLMGNDIPMRTLAGDLWLRDTKLYINYFDKSQITGFECGYNRNIAISNNDFANVCRKYLKSDEDMLQKFLYYSRYNPADVHAINYITNFEGFTLNDLVSYDYKHNEANGENNNDGENYNYSWNCGVEGVSRKSSIESLRMRQIRNAFVFLLMSQAVPMILAGDEFLNSQNGNNNPYCQDNEIGWLVWKNSRASKEMTDYVRNLIELRKKHPVLRPEREYRIMDYAACGFPDLSYHGEAAWAPRFDNHLRHVSLMICGKYARIDKTTEDDFFYIAYNMHWEEHDFALPKLPKGLKWEIIIVTSNDEALSHYIASKDSSPELVRLMGRSIAIVKSRRDMDLK